MFQAPTQLKFTCFPDRKKHVPDVDTLTVEVTSNVMFNYYFTDDHVNHVCHKVPVIAYAHTPTPTPRATTVVCVCACVIVCDH